MAQLSLARAYEIGGMLLELLRQAGALEARMVGQVRRGDALVSEIEILVRGLSPNDLTGVLASVSRGEDHASPSAIKRMALPGGGTLCVRATSDRDWLAMLIERTGDTVHTDWLRQRAEAAGWSWQELAERAGTEAKLYEILGLAPLPPELRQGTAGNPNDGLVTTSDLRGIFHCHTDWSDGQGDLVQTIRAAAGMGFSFVGISDHSRSDANGLDETRLSAQRAAVMQARKEVGGIIVFHGIEVDILQDGSLDLPDRALAELDFVIASVHSHHDLPSGQMTDRIVKALHHPLVTFLGHPTGRYRRYEGYSFDLDAVYNAAIANDVCLELNGSPRRLDPPIAILENLVSRDAKFIISPDAHAPWRLGDAFLGVILAREARMRRDQVLNAGAADDVLCGLARRRAAAVRRLGLT